MKYLVTIIFAFLILNRANSQFIVGDSVQLKRGIYKNFTEFKNNDPSILLPFEAIEKDKNSDDVIKYTIQFKSVQPHDYLWGFCDGKDVYINFTNVISDSLNFDKILILGRYCYYEKFETKYDPKYINAPIPIAGTMPTNGIVKIPTQFVSESRTIIDLINGRSMPVNKENIEAILSKDRALYNEYKKDKNKRDNYIEYIKAYNGKHIDELELYNY